MRSVRIGCRRGIGAWVHTRVTFFLRVASRSCIWLPAPTPERCRGQLGAGSTWRRQSLPTARLMTRVASDTGGLAPNSANEDCKHSVKLWTGTQRNRGTDHPPLYATVAVLLHSSENRPPPVVLASGSDLDSGQRSTVRRPHHGSALAGAAVRLCRHRPSAPPDCRPLHTGVCTCPLPPRPVLP